MPRNDSYFLSRFTSQDSGGEKVKKGQPVREKKNAIDMEFKKEGTKHARPVHVRRKSRSYLFSLTSFFAYISSYPLTRGRSCSTAGVSVKLQRLRPSKQTSKLSRRTLRAMEQPFPTCKTFFILFHSITLSDLRGYSPLYRPFLDVPWD